MVDDSELTYLQRPAPTEESTGALNSADLLSSKGLSKRSLIDSGFFEDCLNIDVGALPVIQPIRLFTPMEDFDLRWKQNEPVEIPDGGENPPARETYPGALPIGASPSILGCGKYLIIGSYLNAEDILTLEGWENWNDLMTSGDMTSEVLCRKDAHSGYYYFTAGGSRIYAGQAGEGEDFLKWYCLVVADTETNKAYIALPPVSGNDVLFGTKPQEDERDYSKLYDYMASDPDMGPKRLAVFQRYDQTDDADLGRYETVILAADSSYDAEEYAAIKDECMGDGDRNDGDSTAYYGAVYNGENADYVLEDCERCLCTPMGYNGGTEFGASGVAAMSKLYHMTSTELKIPDERFRGFMARELNPFNGANFPESSVRDESHQSIVKVESMTAFVPGAVPAKALWVANSRLYCLWGGGVYVSAYNNYADFSMKFEETSRASEPWSSLSSADSYSAGDFVAAAPYGGRVVCFKENSSMEVRGSNSPFTLSATSSVGTVSPFGVCAHQGYTVFAGKDNIYLYTGSQPETVGDELCLKNVLDASLTGENEYLYCVLGEKESDFMTAYDGYVMSMDNGCWGRMSLPEDGALFAKTDSATYCLSDGKLYRSGGGWPERWFFETKYISGSTVEGLMLNSLRMILDMDKGSYLKVAVRYGNDEDYTLIWQQKAAKAVKKKKVKFNFKGKKCDCCQIRAEGGGYSCIYALDITYRVAKS